MADEQTEIINGAEVPKAEPGGKWSPEQRMARVLRSQGQAVNSLWTYDEAEQKLLLMLCGENGGLVAGVREKFDVIREIRADRLADSKAFAE